MKNPDTIKTDQELFEGLEGMAATSANINIMTVSGMHLRTHLHTSVYLRSSMFILVLNGTAGIEINFRKYEAGKGEIVLLSFGHFFRIQLLSTDFRCTVLYVSKAYIDEMFSSDMIYKRARYGAMMHKNPVLQLGADEDRLLQQRMHFIRDVVLNQQHLYYREMTLGTLLLFLLDLANIIEKDTREDGLARPARDELYFQKFLELLVLHYRAEHQVDFYAEKLHITTHYLTLIVKRVSGQTVSDLIFQLLFSEAKLLLMQPSFSIQQVASELHFSDQSAFGKFFKRKSGLSPKEFAGKVKKEASPVRKPLANHQKASLSD